MTITASPSLERRLRREISGEVMFDAFSRGRYATDASIYQIMSVGVVVPKSIADVESCIAAARDAGCAILPRGGGTSQSGQTVNHALVVDTTKYLNHILELDVAGRRCLVEPGIVLDELNRQLKPHGLWFPVDISTASRATIGGMAGNNSCGGRSARYGIMRDNVHSIDAILSDGTRAKFTTTARKTTSNDGAVHGMLKDLLALGAREKDEITRRFPKLLRRVGGYNIDALVPGNAPNNFAHLLVGSEGTLAFSAAIELKLAPLMKNRVIGVCHFSTFYGAMDATQHLMKLGPQAVELIDHTMIALARDIDMFRPAVERFVQGWPEAVLLVEFAEETQAGNLRKLQELEDVMATLGFSWRDNGKSRASVVRAIDQELQDAIVEVRKAGLNIMMSMKDEGKPVSFVEDCAVELPDLADYTKGLTEIFARHGTKGTWYAHASVGCLHVRPVLNLRLDKDVKAMRAIAEEAFALVRNYKGSHSGEHGDGIVRSEFHETMFGARIIRAFEEVKQGLDPSHLFNPGRIVAPPRMDDRSLLRYGADYNVPALDTVLDWSAWPGAGGGFQGAIEMCNNNGACRKQRGGVMCPSFRVTGNECDSTRGRANVLRLAISGQLGDGALTGADMTAAMQLCVSCKACKRECPTGVDMARMKIEVLAAQTRAQGLTLHDRLIAYLPRYAPAASKLPWIMNARNSVPGLARLLEGISGFSAARQLPLWQRRPFKDAEFAAGSAAHVVLFADTFNRYFEPDNLRAAVRVLNSAGTSVEVARPPDNSRPLCCGRTFLSVGLIDEARIEARRLISALIPHVRRGKTIIGLEPSCLLAVKDEIPAMLPGPDADRVAAHALMFEDYIAQQTGNGAFDLNLGSLTGKVMLHGHCHQKAFGVMPAVEKTLALIPDLEISTIIAGCCGMAGAFGYGSATRDISMKMGELELFPAIRNGGSNTILVADGTSCRHQIADGTGRQALHVARVLEMALARHDSSGGLKPE